MVPHNQKAGFYQPELKDGEPCLYIPDAHHLLTNTRTKICSSGIKAAGIPREAWLATAKTGKTSLNIAMVEDLVDKQRNSFAQTTFCLDVENTMRDLGFVKEAEFCGLIRNWYNSVDEPAIPVMDRLTGLLNLRSWLLELIKIGHFPPPGSHIKGFPSTLWEGYIVSIERMLVLWGMIKSYNVRSVGTLDVENFFGSFQDIDPKGIGVLQPNDIPQAMATACDLIRMRFNPKRLVITLF